MNQREDISGIQRANKAGMVTYSILVVILEVCYLIEVLKHSRTIGYFVVFSILALLPYVICQILYRADKEEPRIKYAMAAGFGIFYLFIIFTTVSPIAYVYAIMMAVILLSYSDLKLILVYMIGVTVGNIVQVGVMAAQGQIASADMPNIEIRIASLILFGLFMAIGTQISDMNNQAQMKSVEKEKERATTLTGQLLEVSEKITTDIQMIAQKMEVLEESSDKTKASMQEVAQGTGETVDSIQMQLEKTEDIQRTIENVENVSAAIMQYMDDTREELNLSRDNIQSLTEQVRISNEANENVSKELEDLYHYTDQMQSIIQMINNVTEQTSLLSLNASIEAARAGEAGRGFAVVASEISALATQTQQATEDITALIGNISRELSGVVAVIQQMIHNVEAQNDATNNTAHSFEQIADRIEQVDEQSGKMQKLVGKLAQSNAVIVKGIETISAATEEVTAHSSETLDASEENSVITAEVGEIVERLTALAQELSEVEQ